MTPFGYALVSLGLACGYLVWRGSHRFWHSVFGGLAIPIIGLILFGAFFSKAMDKATFYGLGPLWLFLGTVAAIGVLAFIYRK